MKEQKIEMNLKIASDEETVKKLYEPRTSIARFGDGELMYIRKKKLYFQEDNEELRNRLIEVLNSNVPDLLIGLPIALNSANIEKYGKFAKEFWKQWLNNNRMEMLELIDNNKQYYSTQISRFYLDYEDKTNVANYVAMLKKIWENK